MKNIFLIYSVMLLLTQTLKAQTGTIWRMGTNINNQKEFNFNAGNPIYSQNCATGCGTVEGNSTMDDGNGNVILQSTGTDVYDGNWNILPNGDSIGYGNSAGNGCLILQHPGNSNLYYIFSVDQSTYTPYDTLAVGLRYAIADMSLNGGIGEVISKNNVLCDSAYEKMSCTRHCNGVDWWIVVHKWGTNAYFSFKITANGIDTLPIISHTGMVLHDSIMGYNPNPIRRAGSMRISPNGKYLGNTSVGAGPVSAARNIQLFLFNNQTGIVGPRIFMDSTAQGSRDSFCFSHNSKKLYRPDNGDVGLEWGKNLVVYDLSSNDSSQILSSAVGLLTDTNTTSFFNGIQIGPDGKMYMSTGSNSRFITVIDNPDADSADIVMHLNQIHVGYSTFHNFTQFPDCIFARKHQGILRTRKCSYGLENESIILDTMLNVVHEFTWDFGDPASGVNNSSTERNPYHEFTAPGTYTITLTLHNACNQFTITQQFIYNFVTVDAGTDVSICAGDTAFLSANATGGANNFLWQPSNLINDSLSSNPYALPTNNTLFIASQQPSGCVDTVMVNINSVSVPVISQVGINLAASTASSYQWYLDGVAINGATLQEHFPAQIGDYTVVTTDANGCTAASAPFNVAIVGINASQSANIVLYPNPAKEILSITSNTKYLSYKVYNSLGALVMQNNFSTNINIKHLPQGIYLLELIGKNEIEQKMWVKE
jgi:hypothetical protein